jgi:glycosyltransferase involved in cell wall biosynthesis
MRVLHLIKATQIGGAERHLLTLLPALRALGVDVQLLVLTESAKPMPDFLEQAQVQGVFTERLVLKGRLGLASLAALRARLQQLAPDLLHTHLIHADTLGALAAGKTPIISTRHNDDAFRQRRLIQALTRWQWGRARAGIAISEHLRQFCIKVEGAPPDKIHTIHYGLDHRSLSPDALHARRAELRRLAKLPDSALVLGMVCRLIEQKGVSYALQAFQQVSAEFPQAHLVILGDGALKDELVRESRGLGLAERVHFLGWRSDAADLMAGFDLFLMPSLWEGFGLVLLEAMSVRLPIIASAVSAIPEVVQDQHNGLLVPPRDVPALADALRALLSDRSLRLHMGLLGEDRLETYFSVAPMAQATLKLYSRVLA